MFGKSRVVRLVLGACVLAAVSGCAEGSPEPDAGADGSRSEAGSGGDEQVAAGSGGSGGTAGSAGTAGKDAELGCPRDYPVPRSPCRVPESETCTYRGDGACSQTNPDRIAVCSNGMWKVVAPGIACPHHLCAQGLTLDAFCNQPERNCSTPLMERISSYCSSSYFLVRVQPNACSGTSLLTRLGNSGMRFDYDGSGELRSVQSYDDVPFGMCNQNKYVYGTPCELTDTPTPPCADTEGPDDAGI